MDTQSALPAHNIKGISEVLHAYNTPHFGLLAVHLQIEFLLDEGRNGFADASGGPFALAEDDAVIRISDETQSSPFEFLVELIQHDIAQQWTEGASLRRALIRCQQYSVHHHSASEVLVYQRYYATVFYHSTQHLYQFALVHRVEEALQVDAHGILVAFGHVLPRFAQCVVRSSSGAETVTRATELRLVDARKDLADGLLYHAVYHRRDA